MIKLISAIVYTLIALPLALFLQYKILVTINASELMWFVFWIYAPIAVVVTVVFKLLENE